jgi:SAM-dependent methyltransferase
MSVAPPLPPSKTAPNVPANFYRGARFTWHQRRRHALVRRLTKGIAGKRILDYGCGYGDLTFALSKTNSVVGIDIDSDRIAFCRSQYPELEFYEFDGVRAPFPDNSFDVAVSCVVLPFVPDHGSHLRDVNRVLRAHGKAILVTGNLATTRNWLRRLQGLGPEKPKLNVVAREIVEQRVGAAGFEIEMDDYFYDPPFVDSQNLRDMVVDLVRLPLSFARISSTASYYGLVLCKCS